MSASSELTSSSSPPISVHQPAESDVLSDILVLPRPKEKSRRKRKAAVNKKTVCLTDDTILEGLVAERQRRRIREAKTENLGGEKAKREALKKEKQKKKKQRELAKQSQVEPLHVEEMLAELALFLVMSQMTQLAQSVVYSTQLIMTTYGSVVTSALCT